MKYALKHTAYCGLTETVEEMYLSAVFLHTSLLSEAQLWNTFDEASAYIIDYNIDDHKIVLVKDEDVFEARLKGT